MHTVRTADMLALTSIGLASIALTSCAAPRVHTTMLEARDVVAMTDAMTASLAADPSISSRTSASAPWVFTLDRVENMTEHPMSIDERWAVMARVRARLAESEVARERAISFVLPMDQWRRLEPQAPPGHDRLTPTHSLRATFWSDTRTTLTRRADAYLCTFRLTDIDSGAIVWEDAFELERSIARNTLD